MGEAKILLFAQLNSKSAMLGSTKILAASCRTGFQTRYLSELYRPNFFIYQAAIFKARFQTASVESNKHLDQVQKHWQKKKHIYVLSSILPSMCACAYKWDNKGLFGCVCFWLAVFWRFFHNFANRK